MSQPGSTTQALLWALKIDSQVLDVTETLNQQNDSTSHSGFNWLHIQSDAPDSRACLQELGVQNEVIDALCTAETRPKAIQIGDGMLVYLRGINHNPDAEPEDMVSLRLWISHNVLISARRTGRQLLSVKDTKTELEQGYIPASPLDLTLKIITRTADRISETVDVLDEDLTEFESLERSATKDRMKLSLMRRQAAALRRYLAPQRDALAAMYRFDKILTQQQAFDLNDQTDRMTRYVESLDLAKERAMLLQDELRNRIAEQQGMRMYVLSLVTAIFLPLSFLTGIFGMNVAGLPGTQEPKAFFYLILGMLLIAIMSLIGMLWKKWF